MFIHIIGLQAQRHGRVQDLGGPLLLNRCGD